MPSLQRMLLLFGLALLTGWAFTNTVQALNEPGGGEAPKPTLPDLTANVEVKGSEPTKYLVAFDTLPLDTPNGDLNLRVARVKSFVLEQRDNEAFAVLEMLDHSHLSGNLRVKQLAFRDTQTKEAKNIPVAELSKIKFDHPKNIGLFAVIIGLITLTLMEVVLGIDNIIFLAIVAGKLPPEQQPKARRIGLAAALGTRLLLLASLSFLLQLTKPIFQLPTFGFLENPEARAISWRDIILLVGGLFLIGKSTMEMRDKVERANAKEEGKPQKPAKFAKVIVQIAIIDIIFSLDSVITAVGMVEDLWVMITAMLIAVGVMMVFAEPISRFVERNPTIKVLALSFLILIGVLLVAEGLGQHMDKGYIYFAMAFALVVEMINMRLRPKATKPAEAAPAT
jgi:predicted tellurium resistance membrane protein TerC